MVTVHLLDVLSSALGHCAASRGLDSCTWTTKDHRRRTMSASDHHGYTHISHAVLCPVIQAWSESPRLVSGQLLTWEKELRIETEWSLGMEWCFLYLSETQSLCYVSGRLEDSLLESRPPASPSPTSQTSQTAWTSAWIAAAGWAGGSRTFKETLTLRPISCWASNKQIFDCNSKL